jgi:carboxypeptidase D
MYDPVIGQYEYAGQTLPAVPYVQKYKEFFNFNEVNPKILGYQPQSELIFISQTFLGQLADAYETCGYAAFNEKYLTFPPPGPQPVLEGSHNNKSDSCDVWTLAYTAAFRPNPCFNVYEISSTCPILSDPLGFPSDLQYQYPGMGGLYFNRTDVKTAMHGKFLFCPMLIQSTDKPQPL